jgi:hypothetical protein
MEDQDPPSWAIRVFGPVLFLIGAIAALLWFGYSLYALVDSLSSKSIMLDKGSFYLLGVGLGMSTLAFVVVYEFWYGKHLTDKLTKVCNRLAYTSIALLLIVPQAFHYIADSYLTEKGYSVCVDGSSQWLFVSEILYVDNMQMCGEDLKD